MKGKILIFSLLMFIPNVIKAECGYNEKVRLQSLASNLDFTYNYKEVQNGQFYKADFSITITNLHPELYIDDNSRGETYYYSGKEVTINNYNAGSTIGFEIYANSGSCKGSYLLTNYVTLPPYNSFYKDPICNDVTDFKLCNRWNRVTLSYDEFVNTVKRYKEQKKQEEEIPNIKEDEDLALKIIVFLSKYSLYIFGGIIIICSGLIFYLSRKDDFDLK